MYISNYYPSWLPWVLPRDSTLRFSLNGCSSKNLQQPQGSPWLWSWQQAGVQCAMCIVHCVKFSVQCDVSSCVQCTVFAVLSSVLVTLCAAMCGQCSVLCCVTLCADLQGAAKCSQEAELEAGWPGRTWLMAWGHPGGQLYQTPPLVHTGAPTWCTIQPPGAPPDMHNCTTAQLHNSQLHNCTRCNNIDLLSSVQFFANRDTLVSTTTAHPSVKCRMFQNNLKLGHRVSLI